MAASGGLGAGSHDSAVGVVECRLCAGWLSLWMVGDEPSDRDITETLRRIYHMTLLLLANKQWYDQDLYRNEQVIRFFMV